MKWTRFGQPPLLSPDMIFVTSDLDLHFQDQLIWYFGCRPYCHYFHENCVNIIRIIAEIQRFLLMMILTYIFKVRRWENFCGPWFHQCGRKLVQIGPRKDKQIVKPYYYYNLDLWCQGHPSIFLLIVHYFPKHMLKE